MLALRKRLERWKQSAWEAECAIFGREDAAVSGSGSGLTVQNQSENDARIRNLVSAIGDAAWHEFYLIGQDFYTVGKNNRGGIRRSLFGGGRGFLFGGWKGIYHHAHPGAEKLG
ncbi:MAG: hypothetical protein ACLTR6_02515 [Clostridium fessum]